MRRDDWIIIGGYALGSIVLSLLGPNLWQLPQSLASIAAAGAGCVFASVHIIWCILAAPVSRRGSHRANQPDIANTSMKADEDRSAIMLVENVPANADEASAAVRRFGAIMSLRDRRPRHVVIGDNVDDSHHVDSGIRALAEAVVLARRLGASRNGTRIFCHVPTDAIRDQAFRDDVLQALDEDEGLAAGLVLRLSRNVETLDTEMLSFLNALIDRGCEVDIRVSSIDELLPHLPGTLRTIASRHIDGSDRPAVMRARRQGYTIIADRVDDPVDIERLRGAGIALAAGCALDFGSPVPLSEAA
ncbi:MAG: hypothetical protein AAF205_10490 [Pseudomonadota bacterium]